MQVLCGGCGDVWDIQSTREDPELEKVICSVGSILDLEEDSAEGGKLGCVRYCQVGNSAMLLTCGNCCFVTFPSVVIIASSILHHFGVTKIVIPPPKYAKGLF